MRSQGQWLEPWHSTVGRGGGGRGARGGPHALGCVGSVGWDAGCVRSRPLQQAVTCPPSPLWYSRHRCCSLDASLQPGPSAAAPAAAAAAKLSLRPTRLHRSMSLQSRGLQAAIAGCVPLCTGCVPLPIVDAMPWSIGRAGQEGEVPATAALGFWLHCILEGRVELEGEVEHCQLVGPAATSRWDPSSHKHAARRPLPSSPTPLSHKYRDFHALRALRPSARRPPSLS